MILDALIPAPYRLAARLIGAALIVALIVGLVLAYGSSRYDAGEANVQAKWNAERVTLAGEVQKAQADARAKEATAAQAAAKIDQQHEELNHVKTDNADLRRKLAAGSVRVRWLSSGTGRGNVPGSAQSASVGDGAAEPGLDPAVAQSLAGITDVGDTAIRKMTALQDYINNVVLPTCGAH